MNSLNTSLRVAVTMLAILSAAGTWTNAARAGDRVAELQQVIDDADAEIRRIVQDLSQSGLSQDAIDELNRQLKAEEKRRSNAQFALYQDREAQRRAEEAESRTEREIDAFIDAVAEWAREEKALATAASAYAAEVERYLSARERDEADIASHNADVERYDSAVRSFNALPASQQTQAEYDRLVEWKRTIDQRRSQGNARTAELNRWGRDIDTRGAALVSRAEAHEVRRLELRNWQTRLEQQLVADGT